MLELSSEDSLRLNVLVNNVEAIRIEERSMTVFGLSTRGEAKVILNPTGRPEQYLKAVREFLSTFALGSPGGYPVHLNRWTRMGQARDANLDKLLMLGEPEAVMAVVCAPGLTETLAQRAWWVDPSSENARRMLARECVASSALGQILAGHLVEHLPFETEPRMIIDSVRLSLQPGLISGDARQRLWEKGASQAGYRVGFLEADPDNLLQPATPHPDYERIHVALEAVQSGQNPFVVVLDKVLSASGQAFLAVATQILQRASNQEVVVALLNAQSRYFRAVRWMNEPCQDVARTIDEAAVVCSRAPEARQLLDIEPALLPMLVTLVALASMDEAIVTPVFARSTASGSLMRRKIEPVITPVLERISILQRPLPG